MRKSPIPSTYVPARNTIFLSFALSCADVIGARAVVIGANAIDYSGYPDCRPRYIRAMQQVSRFGTKSGDQGRPITVHAPLIRRTKTEIVQLALRLGVPIHLTWSCYQGKKKPCGQCDSCLLRIQGFKQAEVPDPALNGGAGWIIKPVSKI